LPVLHCCAAAAEPPAPPRQVVSVDLSGVGHGALESPGGAGQSILEGSASFLQRQRLAASDWYWGWGLRGDVFAFDNTGGFPVSHLQDYAAQLSLEYMVHGRPAAWLTLHPGLYYERTPTLSAWDVPLEAVSAIPISPSVSGVLGVDYARFYYLPVPIAGVTWAATPRLRANLVYPDPSVVLTLSPRLEARLAGELGGGGFKTDAVAGKTHVEYFDYHIGAHLAFKLLPGLKLEAGAGYVVDRTFEFLPGPERLHGNAAPFGHLGVTWSR
jgi:hypothetical protein